MEECNHPLDAPAPTAERRMIMPIWACEICGSKNPSTNEDTKPQTNADRIRAMTDEELAVALYRECEERESCYGCFAYRDDGNCPGTSLNAWKKWLKQPAEE